MSDMRQCRFCGSAMTPGTKCHCDASNEYYDSLDRHHAKPNDEEPAVMSMLNDPARYKGFDVASDDPRRSARRPESLWGLWRSRPRPAS